MPAVCPTSSHPHHDTTINVLPREHPITITMALSSERSQHCPFLNRTDYRCGKHFRLDHLDHAFEFCFDRYTACPTYLERLVERRLRQDDQSQAETASDESATRESDGFVSRAAQVRATEAQNNIRHALVQVTVSAAVRDAVASNSFTASADAPIAIKLATAVPGPRINAGSIFRGFDRLARRTVFRETHSPSDDATGNRIGDRIGDTAGRAA